MSGSRDAIPLLDLKAQYDSIREEVQQAIDEVLESQHFIMGAAVGALENEIAAYCDVSHAIGCASGSDALLLALMALDIAAGDQVICPTYTFFATAGAVWRLGAEPIFVDIDPFTCNVAPEAIERAAQRCQRLKAVIPVHLYGQAAELEPIEALARERGIALINDAAQAIGCIDSKGRRMGSSGDLCCFSFFPSKNLGAYGDGGLVTTADDDQAARLRALRTHGASRKYFHDYVGFNSRLDTLQAAVLRVKLPHLHEWDDARGGNARRYDAHFREAGGADSSIPLDEGGLQLRTPARGPSPARHVFNQYVIRVPAERRDPLRAHLEERRIGSAIYYPMPLHLQPCFASLGGREGDCPEAEAASRETLAIPVYPELGEAAIDRVAETVIAFLRH